MTKYLVTTATADSRVENNYTGSIYDEQTLLNSDYKNNIPTSTTHPVVLIDYVKSIQSGDLIEWITTITKLDR